MIVKPGQLSQSMLWYFQTSWTCDTSLVELFVTGGVETKHMLLTWSNLHFPWREHSEWPVAPAVTMLLRRNAIHMSECQANVGNTKFQRRLWFHWCDFTSMASSVGWSSGWASLSLISEMRELNSGMNLCQQSQYGSSNIPGNTPKSWDWGWYSIKPSGSSITP